MSTYLRRSSPYVAGAVALAAGGIAVYGGRVPFIGYGDAGTPAPIIGIHCSGSLQCDVSDAGILEGYLPPLTVMPGGECPDGSVQSGYAADSGLRCVGNGSSGTGQCPDGSVVSGLNLWGSPTCVTPQGAGVGGCPDGSVVSGINLNGVPTCTGLPAPPVVPDPPGEDCLLAGSLDAGWRPACLPNCMGEGEQLRYSANSNSFSCVAPGDWTALEFSPPFEGSDGGWRDFGPPAPTAAYRYVGGRVYLRGAVKFGNMGWEASAVPPSYAPPGTQQFSVATYLDAGVMGILRVNGADAGGGITPMSGANGAVFLDGVSWSVQ